MLLREKRFLWVMLASCIATFLIFNVTSFLKSIDVPDYPAKHYDHNEIPALQEIQRITGKGVLLPDDLAELERQWQIANEAIKLDASRYHAEYLAYKAEHRKEGDGMHYAFISLIWIIFLAAMKLTSKEIIVPQLLIFIVWSGGGFSFFEAVFMTALNVGYICIRYAFISKRNSGKTP